MIQLHDTPNRKAETFPPAEEDSPARGWPMRPDCSARHIGSRRMLLCVFLFFPLSSFTAPVSFTLQVEALGVVSMETKQLAGRFRIEPGE